MSEFTYTVVSRTTREKVSKPRVYISGEMEKPEFEPMDFPGYGNEADLKAYDASVKAYNKEQAKIWKRHVQAAQAEGKLPEGKVKFSMKAGCSCNCSPGFILEAELGYTEYWVDVTKTVE